MVFCVNKRVFGFFQDHQSRVSLIQPLDAFQFTGHHFTGTNTDGHDVVTILQSVQRNSILKEKFMSDSEVEITTFVTPDAPKTIEAVAIALTPLKTADTLVAGHRKMELEASRNHRPC